MKNSLKPKSPLRTILGMKPKRYKIQLGKKRVDCMDLEKKNPPNEGRIFSLVQPFPSLDLWAFYDPLEYPASRWLDVSPMVQLATAQPSPREMVDAWKTAKELSDTGQTDNLKRLIGKASQAAAMTDDETKWLNLATAFLISEDEDPFGYLAKHNKPKRELLFEQPPIIRRDVSFWAMEYLSTVLDKLYKKYPSNFDGDAEKSFLNLLQGVRLNSERTDLAVLQMAGEDATRIKLITNTTLDEYFATVSTWAKLGELKKGK